MYKKRNKFNIKKMVFICLLIVAIISGIIINVVNTDRQLTIFEKAIKDGVLMVSKTLSSPFKLIKQSDSSNEELSAQINALTQENEELKKHFDEMKSLLEIKDTVTEYEKLNATVIGRDLGHWYETITIDKGEYSGITSGMPVVVSEGLMGRVISTTTFTSTVRLLTANNSNNKISIKINMGQDYIYGILSSYKKENDTYIVEGIAQNASIEKGLVVTTTGMGDIFPSGIVIGTVVGVSTDNFDLAKVIEIKSSVNFDKINYVTVLRRNIR